MFLFLTSPDQSKMPRAKMPRTSLALAAVLLAAPCFAQIQSPSQSSGGARATQVPLSGRQSSSGGVQVQQSAGGSGADTLNTSISVSGNTSGSVPDPSATTAPINYIPTPAGTYNVTVSASAAGLTHSVPLTLTIQ